MLELHGSSPEFHTILAALRFYQEHRQDEPAQRSAWIDSLATNSGQIMALDATGIDRLCLRLNTDTTDADQPA
jgi:hypothetical protein